MTKYPSLTSALALATFFAVTGGTVAQTTVGSQTVGEGQMAEVQAHCDTLHEDPDHAAAAGTVTSQAADDASKVGAAANTSPSPAGAGAGAAAPATPAAAAAPAAAGAEAALNIDAITLEDCQAAGLIE